MKDPRVFHDGPISSADEDELDVVPFVKRLVRPLLEWPAQESLVLGLYGSWGQGKSSVLKLLRSELEKSPVHVAAIVVPFNPWYHSSEAGLLFSLFGTIAEEIGSAPLLPDDARKAVAKGFRAFGKVAGPVATMIAPHGGGFLVGPAAQAAADLLSGGQANLEKEKKKLAKSLLQLKTESTYPTRVIVLIDDLDRLDDSEVRAMLKLVKAVADLPNISYVLAVDDIRVRQVLTSEHSDSYGQSFLEKIVQVPIQMPTVSVARLEDIVKGGVTAIIREASGDPTYEVFPESDYATLDFYADTIGRRVRTLRDRARLLNTLRFMLLAGDSRLDIYAEDALLVAFLQTFYPDVYRRIARNKELMIGQVSERDRLRAEAGHAAEVKVERARALNQVVTGVADPSKNESLMAALHSAGMSEEDVTTVDNVIKRMFPNAENAFEWDDGSTGRMRRDNRVAHPERFDRYFKLQAPPGEVSDELIDKFLRDLREQLTLAKPAADERQAVADLFKTSGMTGESSGSFAVKLVDRVALIPAVECVRVARGIEQAAADLEGSDVQRILRALAMRASSVAPEADRAARAGNDRDTGEILAISLRLVPDLLDCLRTAGAYIAGKFSGVILSNGVKTDVLKEALGLLAGRIAGGESLFEARSPRDAMNIVWNWRDLLRLSGQDLQAIQVYMKGLLANNAMVVLSILRGVAVEKTPSVFSFDDGEGGQSVRSALEEVVGIDLLVSTINNLPDPRQPIAEAFLQLVRPQSASTEKDRK